MRRHSFVSRDRCPGCGSGAAETLFRRNFNQDMVADYIRNHYKVDPVALAGADYQLVRCGACTLLYQRWVGDDALLEELYGVWIESDAHPESDPQYREAISAPAQSRDGHEIMAASASLGEPIDRMTTLDYGMGWALWARNAKRLGCRSYGNELSPTRIAFARREGIPVLSDEEIGTQRFHFINTEQVFEHVVQPGRLARLLADALLPGGILKISVPSGERWKMAVQEMQRGGDFEARELVPFQPLEHVNSFTRRSVELLGASVGLRIYRPRIDHRYAFLRHASAVPLSKPKQLAKELVRPIYQYHNRWNLYRWLRKPG